MRIAVVSDIHGNRTAFEAVLADLRQTAPDLVLHGGDLADSGSSPAMVVDIIRDLRWNGVIGNTDEMLAMPETLDKFAARSSAPPSLWAAIREMAAATRVQLGDERIDWLRSLPRVQIRDPIALVHASPDDPWKSPGPDANDAELESVYGPLGQPIVVYCHIHQPFIRGVKGMVVANAGSVSLSHDGDRRASYLLLDGNKPTIRRVEYDWEKEIKGLSVCDLPHADWVARIIESGRPQLP